MHSRIDLTGIGESIFDRACMTNADSLFLLSEQLHVDRRVTKHRLIDGMLVDFSRVFPDLIDH